MLLWLSFAWFLQGICLHALELFSRCLKLVTECQNLPLSILWQVEMFTLLGLLGNFDCLIHIFNIVWWDLQSFLSLKMIVGFIFFLGELMKGSAIHILCSPFRDLSLWLLSCLAISACLVPVLESLSTISMSWKSPNTWSHYVDDNCIGDMSNAHLSKSSKRYQGSAMVICSLEMRKDSLKISISLGMVSPGPLSLKHPCYCLVTSDSALQFPSEKAVLVFIFLSISHAVQWSLCVRPR